MELHLRGKKILSKCCHEYLSLQHWSGQITAPSLALNTPGFTWASEKMHELTASSAMASSRASAELVWLTAVICSSFQSHLTADLTVRSDTGVHFCCHFIRSWAALKMRLAINQKQWESCWQKKRVELCYCYNSFIFFNKNYSIPQILNQEFQ